MQKNIPYGRQTIEKDDIQAVVEVLKSDYLTTGPKIKEFETQYNVLVYAVTHEYTDFGECYDFLYIPDDKSDWKYMLMPQKTMFYVSAYVWNKSDDMCSEFGTIGIRSFGGGIKRVM